MKLHTALTATLLFTVSAAAFAQAATPRIDNRQERQEKRIEQGQASGALTARENARLEAQQTRIERAEDRAKADGTVTAAERARLTHKQNKASRNIYRQKHDAQGAKPAEPAVN